jgi:hypothetical protein
MKERSISDLEGRAAEALRLARRLLPGPERNELRQIARTLRALARLTPPQIEPPSDGNALQSPHAD